MSKTDIDDSTLALAFAFQTESARIALLGFAARAAQCLRAERAGLNGSCSLVFLHSAADLCAAAYNPGVTFVATTGLGAQGMSAWAAAIQIACDVFDSMVVRIGRPGDVFPTPEEVHEMARKHATFENMDKALFAADVAPKLFEGQNGKRLYEATIPAWRKTTEAFPSGCRLANDPTADGRLVAALAALSSECFGGFDAPAAPPKPKPSPIEAPAATKPKGEAPSNKLDSEPIPVKAMAAALALMKDGEAISLRAVCERAGIDRANLRRNHPDTMATIKAMAKPDRAPRRGVRDVRTGDVDAYDFDDEE